MRTIRDQRYTWIYMHLTRWGRLDISRLGCKVEMNISESQELVHIKKRNTWRHVAVKRVKPSKKKSKELLKPPCSNSIYPAQSQKMTLKISLKHLTQIKAEPIDRLCAGESHYILDPRCWHCPSSIRTRSSLQETISIKRPRGNTWHTKAM